MTKPIPDYLRLVVPAADAISADADDDTSLVRLCKAFEQATGWKLSYEPGPERSRNPNLVWSAPVDPGVGASLGLIRSGFASPPAEPAAASFERAVALAEAVAHLWSETIALRDGVRSREAELAADLPVVARREAPAKTAERFTAILKGGAEAVGCQAAALYLLDAATTCLKLRAVWGLPQRKLLEPARDLAGAMGDLEALLGHAVVLSDPQMNRYWHAPEASGASVCVPVSSPTTPLGTLWIFSDDERDFNDRETNLIEIVAGRLAAELERAVLLDDARHSQLQRREIAAAAERQSESLPRTCPPLEGWQVAGRVIADANAAIDTSLAGAFFDWFGAMGGAMALSVGAAADSGFGGAIVAAELRSAVRAQADRLVAPESALATAHEVLTSLSAGGTGASLCCALLPAAPHTAARHPEQKAAAAEIRFAAAGHVHALVVRAQGCRELAGPSEALVVATSPEWCEIRARLNSGEFLLVYVAGALDARWQEPGSVLARLAERLPAALPAALPDAAERLADLAARALAEAAAATGTAVAGALLVIGPRA